MKRSSGILCHISSLSSPFGIGDMGPGAYRFIDFLSNSGQSYWQILPLNPTDGINFHSPYSSFSAFGCNTLFISPEKLVEYGFLSADDLKPMPSFSEDSVEFEKVIFYKDYLFEKAFVRFQKNNFLKKEYETFLNGNQFWCNDFALFVILKKIHQGQMWTQWPEKYLRRDQAALEQIKKQHSKEFEKILFLQFIFEKQWEELRQYCHDKNVRIIGDIPIYVTHDSVDVWSHSQLFQLDEHYNPVLVAGVPPDYFSETGQRWGNPVYDWPVLQNDNFGWWVKRFERNFALADVVRIDHFRGLVKYWAIPVEEKTAIKGSWEDVPVDAFLSCIKSNFKDNEVIAEDLGIITPDVEDVMRRFHLPGMKILLFAFNGDMHTHPYLPHNCPANSIIYTGTHDNNTVKGWFDNEATPQEKENMVKYTGHAVNRDNAAQEMIDLAFGSPSGIAIIPIQDVLSLGQEARMNRPATVVNNWIWKLSSKVMLEQSAGHLRNTTQKFHRI